jgi:hypothetical protein
MFPKAFSACYQNTTQTRTWACTTTLASWTAFLANIWFWAAWNLMDFKSKFHFFQSVESVRSVYCQETRGGTWSRSLFSMWQGTKLVLAWRTTAITSSQILRFPWNVIQYTAVPRTWVLLQVSSSSSADFTGQFRVLEWYSWELSRRLER